MGNFKSYKVMRIGTKIVLFALILVSAITMFIDENLALLFMLAFSILRCSEFFVSYLKEGRKKIALTFLALVVTASYLFYKMIETISI